MLTFDPVGLKDRVSCLSSSKQAAFSATICERMLPAFEKFSSDTDFPIEVYRQCMNYAWTYLSGNTHIDSFERESKRCLDAAPDTEAFEHDLTSAALNASLSIGLLMNFLAKGNIDDVVETASLACDTVALYVQHIAAPSPLSLNLDSVRKHPLMQEELQRQAESLKFLARLPNSLGTELVDEVKANWMESESIIPLVC